MDFKKHIQNKYQREVNPELTDSAWHTFLQYRQKKKRKPFLFLWIATGSALAVILSLYLVSFNKDSDQRLRALIKSPDTTEIPKSRMEPENLLGPAMKSISLSELNSRTNVISTQKATNKPLKSSLSLKSTHPGGIDQKKFRKEDILSNPKSTGQTSNQMLPAMRKVDFLLPLPLLEMYAEQKIRIPEYSNQKSGSFSADQYHWKRSTFGGQLYGGLAFPSDVQTVEEKAFQVGAKSYFNAGRKIRLKSGLELGSISFISKMMNPQLGVDLIEAPTNTVRFDHAIVESISINLDLGIDFLLFSSKNWETYTGIAYQLSKEIVKDIDYSFEGNDDLSNSDDILIAKKNSAKYFVPHILKLESGIRYKTPIGGINLSFTYPYQLSKTNIDLLRQFQINIGFSQRL